MSGGLSLTVIPSLFDVRRIKFDANPLCSVSDHTTKESRNRVVLNRKIKSDTFHGQRESYLIRFVANPALFNIRQHNKRKPESGGLE